MAQRPTPVPRKRKNIGTGLHKCLMVRNLPDDISKETIELFFESKRQFGQELAVDNVKYDVNENWAVVTYEKSTDAQVVINIHRNKPCHLNGQLLDIALFDGDLKNVVVTKTKNVDVPRHKPERQTDYQESKYNVNSDIIEVRGISDTSTEESLRFYFENTRRSGGGPISLCQLDTDCRYLYLQFEKQSVLEAVLKNDHVVENSTLTLKKVDISKKELLFLNIPENTSQDLLTNFLEARLQVVVNGVTMYEDVNKALVSFTDQIDLKKAISTCKTSKIKDVNITPRLVPITNTVIVTNLSDLSDESVELYFENKLKSNGGELQKVKFYNDHGYCLLSFKDPDVVHRVCCKKDHKINGEKITVEPYYEFLPLPEVTQLETKAPEPIVLHDVDEYKIKFTCKDEQQRQDLGEKLKKCHATVDWEKSPLSVEHSVDLSASGARKLFTDWERNVRAVIEEHYNEIDVKLIEVESSVWKDVMDAMRVIVLPDSNSIVVFAEKNNSRIVVVAHRNKISSSVEAIQEVVENVVETHRQENIFVTEKKEFAKWEILYLEKVGCFKDIEASNPNLTVDLTQKTHGEIVIAGSKGIVTKAIKDMKNRLRGIEHREIEVDSPISELLQNDKAQEYLDNDVIGIYVVSDETVVFFAENEAELDDLETTFWNTISVSKIRVDAKKKELLESPQWHKLEKSMKKNHEGCLVLNISHRNLEIYTVHELEDEIVTELQEFLSENAEYKTEIKLNPTIVKYIQKVARKKYDEEMQSLKGCKIIVDLNEDTGIITLEGTSDAIKNCKKIFEDLSRSISVQSYPIQGQKISDYFASVRGKQCLLNVQESTPCIVEVKTPKQKSESGKMERFEDLVLCASVEHPSGTKIQIFGGDIVSIKADVIVNPANSYLEHNGGLAQIIAKRGGRRITSECEDYIQSNGSIHDGEVFISTAGKLHFKYVIHAVGPYWSGGERGESKALKRAVTECLRGVCDRDMESVVIPALCTGKFRYPVDQACKVIVEAVDMFLKRGNKGIQKIYFCDINTSTVKAFTEALNTVYKNVKLHGEFAKMEDKIQRDSCNFGKVKVSVTSGLMVKEKVDVIINSTARHLKLDAGRSSAAILKSAGNIIQQECEQNYPDGIKYGEVAVTSPGNLKCTKIFHVAINKYDANDSATCFQLMDKCITACLTEASALGLKSISFPALGTGWQKFPKQEAAKQTILSVFKFCASNPTTPLTTIRIVIYTGENQTYEVFRSELMQCQAKHGSRQQAGNDRVSDNVESLNVTIYADTKRKSGAAIKQIEDTIKTEWKTKTITNNNIHKLSDDDMKKFKSTASKKNVDITIDTDIGSIEITGLDVHVLEVTNQINDKLTSIEKWDGKKEKARLMSSLVQWSYVNNQQDCPFPPVTNLDIETAYKQSVKSVKIKDDKKVEFEITFAAMTKVEVNNPGNIFQVKRMDLKADLSLPNTWKPMATTDTLLMVTLTPGSAEYQMVLTDFQRTLGRVPTIAKIERVQNKIMYTQYVTKRSQFDKSVPNYERVLWHGTAQNNIPIINLNGFNRSYSNSGLKGVYFAVNASYSDGGYARPGTDGYKRMYRCLVLTGRTSTASTGPAAPPPLNPAVPHVLHDSVTDNPANPVMFIIFNDTQAYPEHLITYI
ncbi:Poly (ADP-ribose) polymerase [Mactra antiquata]